jgi:hypothetical protein
MQSLRDVVVVSTTLAPLMVFRNVVPQILRKDIEVPGLMVRRVLFEEGQSRRSVAEDHTTGVVVRLGVESEVVGVGVVDELKLELELEV